MWLIGEWCNLRYSQPERSLQARTVFYSLPSLRPSFPSPCLLSVTLTLLSVALTLLSVTLAFLSFFSLPLNIKKRIPTKGCVSKFKGSSYNRHRLPKMRCRQRLVFLLIFPCHYTPMQYLPQ